MGWKTVTCQNCHGNKKVTVWDGKRYKTIVCGACNGTGRIAVPNI